MLLDVCVVVPCLNGGSYLDDTLRSVARQSFGRLEVMIVDDGSTDGSLDVARRWVRSDDRYRLVSGPHRGIARSRRLGAALASPSTRYIAFMDHDDRWHPTALAGLRSALRPGYVGSHGLGRRVGEDGHPVGEDHFSSWQRDRHGVANGAYVRRLPSEPTTLADALHHFRIYPAGVALFRRLDYEAVGGHDARLRLTDDWDLALRLLKRGPMSFVDQVVVDYRQHQGNTSQARQDVVVPETRRAWATYYYDSGLTPSQRSLVRSGWPLLMRTRASHKARRARQEWSEGHRLGAVRTVLDAAAHRALLIPPPRWAEQPWSARDGRDLLEADLGACTVEGVGPAGPRM